MKSLTISLLLLLSLSAAAQEHRVGVYQGINNTSVADDGIFVGKLRRTTYMTGIHYSLTVKKLEYGIGLGYVPRGFGFLISYNPDSTGDHKEFEYVHYQHEYLAIPVSVNYRGNKRFFGQFGMSVLPSFLVRSKTFVGDKNQPDWDNSGVSKFDIGAQVNLGCGLNISDQWSVLARVSFFRSLNTIYHKDFSDIRHKGTSLGFSLEYRIK